MGVGTSSVSYRAGGALDVPPDSSALLGHMEHSIVRHDGPGRDVHVVDAASLSQRGRDARVSMVRTRCAPGFSPC